MGLKGSVAYPYTSSGHLIKLNHSKLACGESDGRIPINNAITPSTMLALGLLSSQYENIVRTRMWTFTSIVCMLCMTTDMTSAKTCVALKEMLFKTLVSVL